MRNPPNAHGVPDLPPRNPRRSKPAERRKGAARKPSRGQPRRRASKPRLKPGRRAWLMLALLALVAVVPPLRRGAAWAWDAAQRAVAAARAEDAREREVARYALRYGISMELAGAIERAARQEGVKTDLAFRLVRVESGFHERAVSPVGAVGLTQVMLPTARGMQPGITREQLFDRETNLRLGFRYYRYLLEHYDGDDKEALHAYNRGMGTVARIRAKGGDPANGYADHVLGERGASPVRRVPPDSIPAASAAPPAHETAPARLPAMR